MVESITIATSAINRPRHQRTWYDNKPMATYFGKPTPSLPEGFESPPSPKVSQRFNSVLDEDVEEKYGPGPIVGGVESRPEQCQKADEVLYRRRTIDRAHFCHRSFWGAK